MNTGKAKRKRKINKSHSKIKESSLSPFAIIAINVVKSMAFLLPVAFIFTIILSLIAYNSKDPAKFISPLSMSILYLYSAFCGLLSVKLSKESWIFCGLFTGIVLLAIKLILSRIIITEPSSEYVVISYLITFISSLIGSALGGLKIQKKRKHIRR